MKKIRIILFLLLFTMFIPSVYASTVYEYERNSSNNYGVNKKWKITDDNFDYVMNTPYVDASIKIYDYSDILTDEEEEELYNRITTLSKEYKMDIVILTYSLPYRADSENEDFATDFYDFNDFGIDYDKYDGVLLFRNTYDVDPYFDMYSFGEAQLTYDPGRMSDILDYIFDDLHNREYLNGFNRWLNELTYYHDKGKVKGYYVDEDSNLKKSFDPHLVGASFFSIIISLIYVLTNVSKNKMVKVAADASTYLNKKSFKLLGESTKLVSSHVSSWTESSSYSGGHSGGGHSSVGHSGGGHSSGGGRHG